MSLNASTKRSRSRRQSNQSLEDYFAPYRKNVIGYKQYFGTPYGKKRIIYADWTASGRLYRPIEKMLQEQIAPFVGNTHTETTVTGCSMTQAYNLSKAIIKKHVKAQLSDILISSNSGMTGVVNKFQRILGLKVHEKWRPGIEVPENERPIVLVSHMEHHSNQTSWLETLADVEVIRADPKGLVCLNHLQDLLERFEDRKTKIAAVTSCSNVTGIKTPYHDIARLMHRAGGHCFVDFACSAPYIDIEMRPEDPEAHLDAIYFSPHKFLGGPATTGILIFEPTLYKNKIPDNPGGGTVDWTNPWGEHKYLEQIEAREDGGTPAFLQTIKVALCVQLKEQMGVDNILAREQEMLQIIWPALNDMPGLHVLADNISKRLGIFSFYIEGLHYNLGVKLLNDRYGIQVRGGCSCAGTYGHYLLEVSEEKSQNITSKINAGDLSDKPGWIRLSIHPVMTDKEVRYILDAIHQLCLHHHEWTNEYYYNHKTNEFVHKDFNDPGPQMINQWFESKLL
ncbi:MAG: aminotransferase class V-fold PLP-dependent enzyme [Bacteroidota bacterium]